MQAACSEHLRIDPGGFPWRHSVWRCVHELLLCESMLPGSTALGITAKGVPMAGRETQGRQPGATSRRCRR
jgi:hypothetical protein